MKGKIRISQTKIELPVYARFNNIEYEVGTIEVTVEGLVEDFSLIGNQGEVFETEVPD